MSSELRAIFEPKTIALIGASNLSEGNKIYSDLFRSIARNLSTYKGKTQTVDLSGMLAGSEKKVNKVAKERDLAIVILPKELLTKNLEVLLARRIKALALVSWDLKDEQRRYLSSIVAKKRPILIGPGSIGIVNMANGLMAVPENSSVLKGRVALISRDFCISGALLNLARKKGISKFIGVGEGMGIREGDILGYMAQDKETSVICTYVEEATDGRKLVSAVKESVVKKPVLLVKGGAESAVFNNVMRQAGLLLVHNIREMLNGASALARQPPMLGDRVAIVTNSAGQGKLIKKYLLEEGLKPSKPSDAVVEKIKKKQPLTKVEDFIFLWHTAKADLYKFVAEQLLSDENLDGVVLVISIKTTAFDLENLNKIVDVTKTSKEKPIIGVLTCADDYTIAEGITATTDFPVYIHPDEAAKVLKILRLRGKQLGKLQKVL